MSTDKTIWMDAGEITGHHILYSAYTHRVGAMLMREGQAVPLEYIPEKVKFEVILIGYDRIGYSIHKTMTKINKNLLVIDFNPDIIRRLLKSRIHCLYGDIGDLEIIERLDFKGAEIIISTVPEESIVIPVGLTSKV